MAEKLVMPALSPTMERGTIVKWHKKEGDGIAAGEILAEVETDKAVMEYPSDIDGVLLKILVPEGKSAGVEDPIAIAGQAGENISGLLATLGGEPVMAGVAPEPTPAAAAPSEAEACPVPLPEKKSGNGRVRSSPLARRMAEEAGLDLAVIPGSGPEGRITRQDVERVIHGRRAKPAARPSPVPPPVSQRIEIPAVAEVPGAADQTIPVSKKRKVIAERLSASKFTAPHYYLRVSAAMGAVLDARELHNAAVPGKISLNAFLMKLTAEALKRHPQINATWNEATITQHGRIDIALAVSQPDGLIAPVVRDCGNKGIAAIDREIKALVEKARSNRLAPADYENAYFTISNLGAFGIEEFTAIINPPGSATLAIGAIEKRPVIGPDDAVVVRRMMTMTLSCDHRLIDGAVGAAFLTELKSMLESPIQALM